MIQKLSALFALTLLMAGCAQPSRTEATVLDFSRASGVYVLAYSTDREMRMRFEDRLVQDLTARDIKAYPSHPDLPDLRATRRADLVRAANARAAMFVLVVEELGHGETGVVNSPGRIAHDDPTLQDYYENTRPADHEHDDATEVFVEASAFLLQGDDGKLVWSGTAWPTPATAEGDQMAGLSETIADAIEKARRDFRSGRL
jgi:hypothetical protein